MKARMFRLCWLFAGALVGCASARSYRVSPYAIESEGVRLTVGSSRCYLQRTDEPFPAQVGTDRVHVDVNVDVENLSNQTAAVSFDSFRLKDDKTGAELAPLTASTVSLLPGQTESVVLGFEQQTPPDCKRPLMLATDGAVSVNGRPVGLSPIELAPQR